MLVDGGIGMVHLAVLAANPGREIDAAELVAGTNALAGEVTAQEQLDPEALRQYRNRLAELRGRAVRRRSGDRRPRPDGPALQLPAEVSLPPAILQP